MSVQLFGLANKAIDSLTQKQRDAWYLVMQQCYSERDAAKMLKISRDALHDRLNKARASVKRYIREHR